MANALTVESVIDKNRISSSTAWVILLDIYVTDPNTRQVVETLRIAQNDEDVSFDGQIYVAANFEVNVEQQNGQAPRCSISAHDQTRLIQQRMEAMAGGVLSEVQMTVVNTARLDRPPEMQETFQIISSSTKDSVVTFELGSENRLSIAYPKHRQSKERCAWRFKGYGCGYAGAETVCDYTLDGPLGCASKNNTINFRALPGLVRLNI